MSTITQDRLDNFKAWLFEKHGQAPNWWLAALIKHPHGTDAAALMMAIASARNRKTDTIFRTNADWGRLLHASERTIQRWFKILEACEIVGPGKGNNRSKSLPDTRPVYMQPPKPVYFTDETVTFALGRDRQPEPVIEVDKTEDADAGEPF